MHQIGEFALTVCGRNSRRLGMRMGMAFGRTAFVQIIRLQNWIVFAIVMRMESIRLAVALRMVIVW